MKDEDKTKEQLIREIIALRKQITDLDGVKAEYHQIREATSKLTFSELVDIQQLKTLLELHFKITNIPVSILDKDQNRLVDVGLQDICTQFHRIHPVTLDRCRQSDAIIKSHLDEGKYIEYRCQNGLYDLAVPIMIAGEHMATLFIGQFFYEDEQLDIEFFRRQAEEFGFDIENYLKAMRQVPVFSREKVQNTMNYYLGFVELLSSMGYGNLHLARDIADRKKVENELRELEKAIETMQLGVTITDTEGKIIYTNPAEAKVHGYRVEELIGKDIGIFAPPELRQPMTLEQIGNMKNLVRESVNIRKDASIFPVRLITDVVKNAEGIPIAIVTICEDITVQKRAEKELRESEERVRGILSSLHETMVIIFDCEGSYKAVWGPPELERRYRFQHNDFVGKSLHDMSILDKEEKSTLITTIRQIFETGKPFRTEALVHFPGGDFWHDISLSPMRSSSGEVTAVVGFILDITQLKQLEQDLQNERALLAQKVEERTAELRRANAELARAARLKDEFLANMSHELRTPLNVILGMSESLQDGVYGFLNDRQLRSLHMVEESGRHLLELINDILDLSKIGAGKLELDIAPVAVETLCQTSLRLIKQSAQMKRLKISSMFDNEVTIIQADGRRLKQVLVNLLNNAVKFTPQGGKIGLEVEGDPEQHIVHLTVWDTGIGIAQKDMRRLFQPFVQLDATLSRKYEGAGLGLSLVYRLVEMHGGSISVASEEGKGSRFTVSLPWNKIDKSKFRVPPFDSDQVKSVQPEERRTSKPYSPQLTNQNAQSEPLKILIADDNEATLRTFSEYFATKNHQVMIAYNGWEAFAHTREHHPDIIVIDIQMPEMDGLEAIRHIRADKHGKNIPIIALTALAMPGDREKCLAAGADIYLSKPVSLRRLSEIVEDVLSQKEQG